MDKIQQYVQTYNQSFRLPIYEQVVFDDSPEIDFMALRIEDRLGQAWDENIGDEDLGAEAE